MMSTQVFMMDSVSKRLNKFRFGGFDGIYRLANLFGDFLHRVTSGRQKQDFLFRFVQSFISFLPQSWHNKSYS